MATESYGKVKCRHCGKSIRKSEAFPHPNKKRNYYCNEQCYREELQIAVDRKINTTPVDNLVTCRCCGKKIKRSQSFCVKDRYYYCSEKEYETQYKGSEAYWEETFLDYIYFDITAKDCDFPLMQRQAAMYHDKYNFKWPGMLLTLQYWYETLQSSWNPDYGLGQIFPKYYEEAKKFYNQRKQIESLVDKMEGDDKIIKIKKKKSVNKKEMKWEDL